MKLTLRMVAVLAAIALISGALLSSLNQWAKPKMKKHAQNKLNRAINSLFPGEPDYEEISEYDENLPLYACYDDSGETLGYAFKASGTGYQGIIELIVGLDRELRDLRGIKILKQVETPGLGARITEYNSEVPRRNKADTEQLKEFKFRNWFENLRTTPQIDYVKNELPRKKNQVQAITGATISSEAVVKIVNNAVKKVKKELGEPVASTGADTTGADTGD